MIFSAITSASYSFTPLFHSLLKFYHLFPLHSPVTLLYMDAPWGRFAYNQQRGREGSRAWGDLDGNLAWAFMEIVSPITFITTILRSTYVSKLSTPTLFAASLFLIHYAHRAVISPLLLAPKRSPQHIWVTSASVFFNLLNGYMIGSFIASNPLPNDAFHNPRVWLCSIGWLLGFLGNVYHDELLHDLRAPSFWLKTFGISRFSKIRKGKGKATAEQVDQQAGTEKDTQTRTGGQEDDTYKIPEGGLFHWIAFPNYTCEWFEWLCYAMLISPNPFITSPPSSLLLASVTATTSHTSLLTQFRNTFIRLMAHLPFPSKLLTPPYMFLVAEMSAMYPRAIRAVGWYEERFGAAWRNTGRTGGRWVVIPGVL